MDRIQPITDIEGLEGKYQQVELENDTPPDATIVNFETYVEDLPFKTEQEGRLMQETRVKVVVSKDLGQFKIHLPLNDKVHFDEEKGKWIIDKITPGTLPDQDGPRPISHIMRWKDAWNAFARGTAIQEIGTPLSVLFRHDPARVKMYERHEVTNLERIAALNDHECTLIGMGALDDRNRARAFIAKAKSQAPMMQMDRELEDVKRAMAEKDSLIRDLSAKLTALLEDNVAAKKAAKGKKKVQSEEIEGV